jgi:hypothetical protein
MITHSRWDRGMSCTTWASTRSLDGGGSVDELHKRPDLEEQVICGSSAAEMWLR